MKKLQAFCKRAQFCGFTSLMQVRVFLAVSEFPGAVTARELSKVIGIEASQVSTVLRALSDWGLVDIEKRVVEIDGRAAVRIYARFTSVGQTSLDMLKMEVAP